MKGDSPVDCRVGHGRSRPERGRRETTAAEGSVIPLRDTKEGESDPGGHGPSDNWYFWPY